MIRIKRTIPAPRKLVEKGNKELKSSKSHYKKNINTREPKYLSSGYFKAYKASGVKDNLKKLFHKKCAYCETKATPSGYLAIEHFRPKASVDIKGKLVPPGYWWLAADWNNLLPSCNQCNTSGKGNLFPINGKRADKPTSNLTKERRLLLNPCRDSPEKHLKFSDDGTIEGLTKKGDTSVEVLGLDRTDLTMDRKTFFRLSINPQIKKIKETIIAHDNRQIRDTTLAFEIRQLLDLRSDESEYAGAVRQITEGLMTTINQYLALKETNLESFVDVNEVDAAPQMSDADLNDTINEILSGR